MEGTTYSWTAHQQEYKRWEHNLWYAVSGLSGASSATPYIGIRMGLGIGQRGYAYDGIAG